MKSLVSQKCLLSGIEASDLKAIRASLKKGAEVNYWSFGDGDHQETMTNPLSLAMNTPDLKVIKSLLESGAAVNFEDFTKYAVEDGNLALLTLLLKHGASPDGVRYWKPSWDDKSGNDTSLTLAAATDSYAMVKALLEAGANAEHVNDNGDCALLIAMRGDGKRMVNLLCQYVSDTYRSQVIAIFEAESGAAAKLDEALSEAIRSGRAEDVRRLIVDNNRDVNRPLHYWDSPLLSFAFLKYNEVTHPGAEQLWEDEPKPATTEAIVDVVKVLLELNTPVDAPSVTPPLRMGTYLAEKYPEIYEEMLQRIPNVDLGTTVGKSTPLMSAATRGEVSAVRLLLQYGADPKLKDERNKTALDSARFQYKYRPTKTLETIIELLIEAGAE